ncbi:MAG TPA: tetratricopeptide repeat protein [Nitrososphaeraceae archaeon]
MGDERGAAASLTNLGIIDAEKGNHTEAIKKYEEALEIAIRIRDKYNTDLILKNIIALNK